MGIDAGSKHIGISATTEKRVLYEADVELRNDIVDLLSSRREARRSRRNRKTRYRQARFNNRKRKNEWLAPSVMQKIQTHLNAVDSVHRILPISEINVEVANFDIKTIKRTHSFRDAAFMGIMRWACYNKLKEQYPDVSLTYGYITKKTRIENNLPKEHYIDARCISGNPLAESDSSLFLYKKVRRHNRKLFKDKILKGGKAKPNQCPYTVFGFHRFDIIKWEDRHCFINSLRARGIFVIKDLEDKDFQKEVNYKKLSKVQSRNGYITKFIKIF